MKEAKGPEKVSVAVTTVKLHMTDAKEGGTFFATVEAKYWVGTGMGEDFLGHGPCDVKVFDETCRDAALELASRIEEYIIGELSGADQEDLPPKGII